MELLTNAEMAEADRLAIAGGIAGITLMENAGRAVADAVAARAAPGGPVTIIAGPGNNGGDGFVAGRLLAARGFAVRLALVGDRAQLKGDAAAAARRFGGTIEPASARILDAAGVVVDALFGAGLDRPVAGAAAEMIAAMNARGAPIVAVDLASGINGTTGAVMGIAVRAAESVTFFRRKPGHVLLPGRLHCGRTHVADIGIPGEVLARVRPQTFLNRPALWQACFPVPRSDGHKYARGHAVVASGGASHTGAARLAARAALRAGAGLVTIASPREALPINAAASLAVMVRPVDGAAELAAYLADRRLNALVLGPGGGVGQAMRELVAAGVAGPRAVVLDADALTSFEDDAPALHAALAGREHPAVLTPHTGEFARLFKNKPEIIGKASKIDMARAAAAATRAVVLLKGADTVIAAPDGRAAVNDNAPPWLATAGAGDVLAGFIAGLLAQGMPGFEAAAAAAWVHGEAATHFGPGLIAEDLPEALPAIYRGLFAEAAGTP
ncbi:MAG TPA: NAD(P)H-hydrate dehydratase [Xanthobacteraceae bacterium]|nr:NAD(P)H-hydrate dehydratase [Xanthobacteraceae bacterium]